MKTKMLKDIVVSMLESHDYKYTVEEEVITLSMSTECCIIENKILTDEESGLVVVYGMLGVFVPPENRGTVLELLNEQNVKSSLSTLFMHEGNAPVVCRCSCYRNNEMITAQDVESALAVVVGTLVEVYPGVVCASLGFSPDLLMNDTDKEATSE